MANAALDPTRRVATLDDHSLVVVAPVQQLSAVPFTEVVFSGAKVLVVTAVSNLNLVRQLLADGVSGAVSKAEPLDVLVEALTAMANGEDWTSSLVVAAIASWPEIGFPSLSPQEQRVVVLYSSGLKITAVARRLDISPHMVKDYLRRIREGLFRCLLCGWGLELRW